MAVTPYEKDQGNKTEQVTAMFDNIAPKYDFLNHLLSLGTDYYWRWRAINQIKHLEPKAILDIATGTGDFAIAALRLKPKKILGIDISQNMISIAEEKSRKKLGPENITKYQIGNSEALELEDNSFDAVTVGFGVRNFSDIPKGMSEICRVLRPGGICVVLEPAAPTVPPFKQLFNFYFRRVLPFIGKIISKDSRAYSYLPESVAAFPAEDEYRRICLDAGFAKVKHKGLTLGICSMYVMQKAKPNFDSVTTINKKA